MNFSNVKNIHFIGIGGIGMSGIAEILLNQGFTVSGSDLMKSENTSHLESLGAKIFIGHSKENIKDAEVVVYTSAVNLSDNEEVQESIARKIPLIRRAEMLAEVSRLNYCLAISGTHGKTTTTSMVGLILIEGGIDPTVIVGGRLKDFGGTNARLGKGNWMVVEADEFDRSFLQLLPTIAIVNNIEAEHLDIYKDLDDLKQTFTEFANKVPFYGFVALCLDDNGARDILSRINKKTITFGTSRHANYQAIDIKLNENSSESTILEFGKEIGKLILKVPGLHNLKNALGALTVSRQLGIEFETIAKALANFNGVYRRFELKGKYKNSTVIDDYAHHPTEVSATLEAARNGWNKKIVCIFQPHTYTRTRDLYKEFGQSFDDADILIVTDVYPSRELPIEGINGKLISDYATKLGHKNVHYIENIDDVITKLDSLVGEDDDNLILTLGAGSIYKLANQLVGK